MMDPPSGAHDNLSEWSFHVTHNIHFCQRGDVLAIEFNFTSFLMKVPITQPFNKWHNHIPYSLIPQRPRAVDAAPCPPSLQTQASVQRLPLQSIVMEGKHDPL